MTDDLKLSRRSVLTSGAIGTAAAALYAPSEARADAPAVPQTVTISLSVNGAARSTEVDVRASLLDVLRDQLGLYGTKKGCDHGQCGACTVLVDGKRVVSCLSLAVAVQRPVTTIEGIGAADRLHPMQQAFVDHDAFQCGYCTPGQIMSAIGCVNEGHADASQVREYMSGNLCRCAAYPNIVNAILAAAPLMKRGA